MKRLICFVFIFITFKCIAQDSVNLQTPYHAVYNHLNNLQDEHYHPAKAAKSLKKTDGTHNKLPELAIKLKKYYDAKGYFIDLDNLPREKHYKDSAAGKARFYPVPQEKDIYLEKYGNKWLYSGKTVSTINKKYYEVYPKWSQVIMRFLPRHSHFKFMGLYAWQFIGLACIIVFFFLFHFFLVLFLNRGVGNLFHNLGRKDIVQNAIRPISRWLSFFVISIVIEFFIPLLQLPAWLNKYLLMFIDALGPLFGAIVVYKLVDLFTLKLEKLAEKTESTLDDQLIPLIRKAMKVIVVIFGILMILQNLNFNITTLLAGISIGGLAFALAAQDTIKNLFGSLMIFMDKPFQIGDWVISGDLNGTVEEVGFRSTRVRTFRDSITYIPNGKLADMTIDNNGLRRYRRFYTTISITYDTPANLIEAFIDGMNEIVHNHPYTRKDLAYIYLNEFGASSLNIMFYIYFAVDSWFDELKHRHEVMIEIIRLAEKIGIRFAFPTQTLHMETFPGQQSLTPVYNLNDESIKQKLATYFSQESKYALKPDNKT